MLYLHHLWIQLHCNLKCKSHHIFLSGVRTLQCTLICKMLCCSKVQLHVHICQPLLRPTKSLSGRCCFARCTFVELTAGELPSREDFQIGDGQTSKVLEVQLNKHPKVWLIIQTNSSPPRQSCRP